MSAERDKNPSGFRYKTCITNDYLVPRYFGSAIARDGFHSIPAPPADPEKEDWKVFKTQTACTTWYRICRDYWGTSRLGAVGRVVARMLQIKPLGKPEG
jgi:hypothetical protein